MGMFGKKRPSGSFFDMSVKSDTSVVNNNPDPNNYKVVQAKEIGNWLIMKINYPNCHNYEGNKILVFKNVTLVDLINQKTIDPHFSNNEKYKSPVARFVPNDEGWALAESLTKNL